MRSGAATSALCGRLLPSSSAYERELLLGVYKRG
jgi:hypothetical protein